MNKRTIIIIVSVVAALIAAIGAFLIITAGPSAEELQAERDATADACEIAVEEAVDVMEELDNALYTSVSFDEYSSLTEELQNEVDDVEYPDATCEGELEAELEDVADLHVEAYQYWDSAIYDYSVTSREMDRELNAYWSQTEAEIADIEQAIESIRDGTADGYRDTELEATSS